MDDLKLVCSSLNAQVQFDAVLQTVNEVVTEIQPEPAEDDFEDIADYELAYEAWSENEFEPKPWLKSNVEPSEIEPFLLRKLDWSINNKRYPIPQLNGLTEFVAFSRQPAEKTLIEQLEFEHQYCVKKFAANVGLLFSAQCCELFQTNHLLQIGEIADDDSLACFFDETFVIADEKHIFSMWTGHERWYG